MSNRGLPSWTWELYADAAQQKWIRVSRKVLRWCASDYVFFRVTNIIGLMLGVGYLVFTYWNKWSTKSDSQSILIGLAALFLIVRSLLAQIAGIRFSQASLRGGISIVPRFDLLIPLSAEKVAIVGQNLATTLGPDAYPETLKAIGNLFHRKAGKADLVKELWLVMQTPLALRAVHPKSAEHMRAITLPALRSLTQDLGEYSDRVNVAFHPAATLSMLVWDWHRESQKGVIVPKLQTTPKITDRLCVVIEGAAYGAVATEFQRFL